MIVKNIVITFGWTLSVCDVALFLSFNPHNAFEEEAEEKTRVLSSSVYIKGSSSIFNKLREKSRQTMNDDGT